MKNLKTLFSAIMFLVTLSAFAQTSPYLIWKFANPQVVSGTEDTLIFEVHVKGDVGTNYFADLQVGINYNPDAFGTNIKASGGLIYQKIGLSASSKYITAGPEDAGPSTFGVSIYPPDPTEGTGTDLMPDTFTPFARFKMIILDNTELAGVNFEPSLMNGTCYYLIGDYGYTLYNDGVYENDFNGLPLTPTNFSLLFSELADPDPSVSNADFIEIYNAGDHEVNFAYYPWYVTVFDGSNYSNFQLTGSIGVGESYVIAGDATVFGGAYPGKMNDMEKGMINNGGTLNFFLSIYGEYTVGTLIDKYGGTGSSYTSKHAVRYFDNSTPNATWTASDWHISYGTPMDMTPGSHRNTLTWDGSGSTEWRDTTNWTASYVPDVAHNVSVPYMANKATISFGDNAYCNELTVLPGTRADASLVILSTPAGDGSLITYGTVTGDVDVQRYVPADQWNYYSSPVSDGVSGVYLHMWMYTYNAAAGNWADWIVPVDDPMDVMTGYAVWTSTTIPWNVQTGEILGDSTTMYNNGTLNNGALNQALTYGSGPQGDGYNFVGNPYISGIDWNSAGVVKTNLNTSTYYVWDSENETYESFTTGSGGDAGQFIPQHQGFMVQVNVGGGDLAVGNSARVHTTVPIWKDEPVFENRLKLSLSNGDKSDNTYIYFHPEGTTGIDYNYDAEKLISTYSAQLFTMSGDRRMSMNTLNNTTESPVVTMGFTVLEAGNYTITASDIQNFSASTPLFLEDLKENQIVNLRENNVYSFYTAGDDDPLRFRVHFADPLGIDDPSNIGNNGIYAYNHDVYVNFTGEYGEIHVYNILGQTVMSVKAENGLNKITMPQGNAAYIVKVVSDKTIVSEKVLIK